MKTVREFINEYCDEKMKVDIFDSYSIDEATIHYTGRVDDLLYSPEGHEDVLNYYVENIDVGKDRYLLILVSRGEEKEDSMKEKYDFECWVIKYGTTVYGRTYRKSCLDNNDGIVVPLCWNHIHNNPDCVLGNAMLESRSDGIYARCTLTDNTVVTRDFIITLLKDRGSLSLSPFINRIIYDGNIITTGTIREVSLVPARIDPDEVYYPVLNDELR